jgi:hypothetical protein
MDNGCTVIARLHRHIASDNNREFHFGPPRLVFDLEYKHPVALQYIVMYLDFSPLKTLECYRQSYSVGWMLFLFFVIR